MPETGPVSKIISQWIDIFTHRSMRDWTRFVKGVGLSLPQFGILVYVLHCRVCSISGISQRMDISIPAASQLVDRLVRSGYLTRDRDPIDQRARQITLTKAGRRLIEASQRERFRYIDQLIAAMTEEEKDTVMPALTAMIEASRRLERTSQTEQDLPDQATAT